MILAPKHKPTHAEFDNAALMADIAAGDDGAFRIVVDMYMQDIFRYAYSIVGISAVAEDVTQETFVKLWTKAANWTPKGTVKNWLLRVTHNLAIDEIRRRRGHIDLDVLTPVLEDSNKSPFETIADAQRSKAVHTALFLLSERQRAAIMLVHYMDYSNKDAAHIMDISVDACESLLARARQKLRTLLENPFEIRKE